MLKDFTGYDHDFYKACDVIENKLAKLEYGRCGFKGVYFEIATDGWSEIEEFIEELSNSYFWARSWQSSHRGGLYRFKAWSTEND